MTDPETPLESKPEPIPAAAPEAAPVQVRCANCGVPLHGDFCYACGQPVKGLIRHLSGIMGDFLDTVLNLDSRVFRTLGPLFIKPGFLTLEYFAGRRVRYVTPLRLFFFLCVVSFFSAQLYMDAGGTDPKTLFDDESPEQVENIQSAKTPEEVQKRLDTSLAALQASLNAPGLPDVAKRAIEKSQDAVRKQAQKRIDRLKARAEAQAAGRKLPEEDDDEFGSGFLSFDGTPWDPKTHPIQLAWLPKIGNDKLNDMAGHMRDNIRRAKHEPKRLITGLFSVLPQTLFVLMPLFAVLLKVMYLFRRRLYMEHLIVALHSHAFIFAALLLMSLFGLLQLWLKDVAPALAPGLDWCITAIGWWMPIYLLVMQKRVYRQGWPMTVFKFGFIGTCYSVLIATGVAVAFVVSLAVG